MKAEYEEMKLSKEALMEEMSRIRQNYDMEIATVEERVQHLPSPGQQGRCSASHTRPCFTTVTLCLVTRILANGSTAFFESCTAMGWKDWDSIKTNVVIQVPDSLKWRNAPTRLLTNHSTAFIWKLCCDSLKGVWKCRCFSETGSWSFFFLTIVVIHIFQFMAILLTC